MNLHDVDSTRVCHFKPVHFLSIVNVHQTLVLCSLYPSFPVFRQRSDITCLLFFCLLIDLCTPKSGILGLLISIDL